MAAVRDDNVNGKNLFSVYSVVSQLAFAVATPLLLFCFGGVRLVDYLGLPAYWRTVSMILGVVVMLCSFVRFFTNLVRVIDRQSREAAPKDLSIGKTDKAESVESDEIYKFDDTRKHYPRVSLSGVKLSAKQREKLLIKARAIMERNKTAETAETSEEPLSAWEKFAEETADKRY